MTTATYAPTASAVTAAPQLAPYGFFGDLAKTFAPVAGQAIGGIFGNSNVGGQIGNAVGHLAGFLPFSAGPMVPQTVVQHPAIAQPQLAPYGFFGDLIKNIAPTAGQALGSVFGNAGVGGQIGSTVGQLAGFLPFSASPAMPQAVIHPVVAQQLAQQQLAQQQLAQQQLVQQQLAQQQQQLAQQQQVAPYGVGAYAPFSAGPTIPQQIPQQVLVPQQLAQQPQLAPYGFFGGALGNVLGGLGGGAIGDLFGNRQLGNTIGTTAGTILGSILPFSAGPMQPYAQTPYVQYTY